MTGRSPKQMRLHACFLCVLAITSTACQGRLVRRLTSLGYVPAGSDKERMAAIPAYVISADDARWLRTREVLAGLHLEATRVQPVKPSQRHAQETHRKHNYDKTADLSDIKTQRYLSLTATWEHLLQKIAHDVDMEDTDFACIFEDDVALHDDLSTTNARKVILHGMDIARSDGVLYMGVCEPECLAETTQWLGNYTFAKCYALCAHAMAVTKAKAVTYMDEMHAAFQHEFKTKGYDSYPQGHVIDQMLLVHARTYNATWAIATNLVDPQTETYGYGSHYGAFIQDKWRHSSSIDTAEALRLSKGY